MGEKARSRRSSEKCSKTLNQPPKNQRGRDGATHQLDLQKEILAVRLEVVFKLCRPKIGTRLSDQENSSHLRRRADYDSDL